MIIAGASRAPLAMPKTHRVSQIRSPWWRRSQPPAHPTQYATAYLQESAHLPASPPVIWALVMPAENSPLFDPRISRGFQVPGTPGGLGEQQCAMHVDGTTTIIEVVEFHETDDTRRAVTRQLSPSPVQSARTVHEVHAAPGGSVMVIRSEVRAPVGAVWPAQAESQWHAHMADYFERVRAVLDAGTQPTD